MKTRTCTTLLLSMLGVAGGCQPGVRVGKMAPDFTLTNLTGQEVSLSRFRGRPVVLTYFATW